MTRGIDGRHPLIPLDQVNGGSWSHSELRAKLSRFSRSLASFVEEGFVLTSSSQQARDAVLPTISSVRLDGASTSGPISYVCPGILCPSPKYFEVAVSGLSAVLFLGHEGR